MLLIYINSIVGDPQSRTILSLNHQFTMNDTDLTAVETSSSGTDSLVQHVAAKDGGPKFNLQEGMIVPYIPPKDMGLSSPIERKLSIIR